MSEKFVWYRTGAQPLAGSSVETWMAHRGEWFAGQFKIFADHASYRTVFEPNFQINDAQLFLNNLDVDNAKQYFERLFDDFLSKAKLHVTHVPLKLDWRTSGDRHYLLTGNILIAILYTHMGAWVIDYFLPLTVVDGDWVSGYRDKGIDPLTRFDTENADNAMQIRLSRGMPVGTVEGSNLATVKNDLELRVTGWLLQSGFMMRPDPNSLPIGHEQ